MRELQRSCPEYFDQHFLIIKFTKLFLPNILIDMNLDLLYYHILAG